MFRKIMLALAGAALLASVLGLLPASADSSKLGAGQRAEFVAHATELGMSQEAVEAAIDKIERGELPDSETGATPISVVTERDEFTITVRSYFEDGSMRVVTNPDFEAMTRAVEAGTYTQPLGVSGCEYMYTSAAITWSNCKVTGTSVTMTMAFRLNATMVRGQSARITFVWDQQAVSYLGTFTQTRFGIVSNSAAEYKVQYTAIGGVSTMPVTLRATIAPTGGLTSSMH